MHQNLYRRAMAMLGCASLALMVAGGAAQAQPGPSTPAELVRQFQAAMAARDVERIANLYAEQGIILTPTGFAVAGRANIRATLSRNLAAGQPALRLLNARFDGGAESGVIIWTWEPESNAQMEPAQRRHIRSMLYVKTSPAGWQITADMFQVYAAPPS